MQRHFSNRGEALAEVAAAKMMTHRTALPKSVFRNRRRNRATAEQWRARVVESIHSTSSPKKKEPREGGTPGVGPLEF